MSKQCKARLTKEELDAADKEGRIRRIGPDNPVPRVIESSDEDD